MADKDYKVFIVEGENREPQIIDNISKIFFSRGNYTVITLPAGENIYMLWKQLKEDDFDTDVIEVLRESNVEIRKQLTGLSRNDFSEVYLFFDYDAHQTNLEKSVNEDIIRQMLESFDNETENGKLYISYPMVEALRDYEPGKCGNGIDCFVEIQELGNYKNTSVTRAYNPHFKEYEQYFSEVTQSEIYTLESKEAEKHKVFVLSAFPEFLLDYFGMKLWKTSVRHRKNQMDSLKCEELIKSFGE